MVSYATHINQLAGSLGFRVLQTLGVKLEAQADTQRRIIYVGELSDATRYFIALHEIGHVALKHKREPSPHKMFATECEAWRWALQRAKHNPTEEVWDFIKSCLLTYSRKMPTVQMEDLRSFKELEASARVIRRSVVGPMGKLP